MLAVFNNQNAQDFKKALEKEKNLEKMLSAYESVLVAYSGGVDSTYLLYKAAEVMGREKVLALTVDSELNTSEEVKEAKANAGKIYVKHLVLQIDLLTIGELVENNPQRCYICKSFIYKKLFSVAEEKKYAAVLDGSNAADSSQYRPGLRALQEMNLCSPLLEAGLDKEEIRYLSKQSGLATWNKPSAACLASRLPYGEKITPAKLNRVAAAEKYLRQLGVKGNLRVRNHRNLARIEVGEEDISLLMSHKEPVVNEFSGLGFSYVTLDLCGFVSGSMDRNLNLAD